jgi:very-short-patch-repair endonuclease
MDSRPGSSVQQATPGWPDRVIAELAAEQRTIVTRRQLLDIGVSRQAIARAIARGRLCPIHRGVYSLVARAALPALALEQAAILACGPSAVLSHETALALWGLWSLPSGPVQVTVVAGASRERPGIVTYVTSSIDRPEIRRREHLPVTSPARALLDVVPRMPPRRIEHTLDTAIERGLISRTAMRELLRRHPGRTGTPVLAALLDPRRPSSATRSGGEERLLRLLRRGGIPDPEVNQRQRRYVPDLVWRQERVLVEFDGWLYHSGKAAFERDRVRQNDLVVDDGWIVVRVTSEMVRCKPERVLVLIATALGRAAERAELLRRAAVAGA